MISRYFYFISWICISTCVTIQVKAQSSACSYLCNIDFEDDRLVGNGQFGFFHEDRVSCWNTTATDRMIEIWGSGFGGVPAYSGSQFAELNANMVSSLFQNFTSSYGSEVEISFAHRGRAGLDRLGVEIGPVGGPYENLGIFSAGNTKWEYNTINYVFPTSGRRDYTIRFNSVSAAGGATVGNFLDAISIKIPPIKAELKIVSPSCPSSPNGEIRFASLKGSPPFQFNWNIANNPVDSIQSGLLPGKYFVTITDFYGCEAVFETELTAIGNFNVFKENIHACNSYYWVVNGETITESGIYFDTLINQFGCDSIMQLDLIISKSSIHPIILEACHEYTWPSNGKIYSQSGWYQDTLIDQNACDSILQLQLTILQPDTQYISIESCESYDWNSTGQKYFKSGLYQDTLINQFGCDSILILDLQIRQADVTEISEVQCESFFWPSTGKVYQQSGIYFDTLTNQFSCDSIIKLNLKINQSIKHFDTIRICENYIWPVNGKSYSQSGLYSQIFKTVNGCDSTHFLQLQILSTSEIKIKESSCNQYTWPLNQKTYHNSGIYNDTLTNSNGCDSIIQLHLTIHPQIISWDTIRKCVSYFWSANKSSYVESGDYQINLRSQFNCDSILNLHLTIDPSYTFTDTISSLDQFFWDATGTLYDQSGIYYSGFTSADGCDSVRVLILKIRKRGEVYLPNVFSPNGDGVNDHFMVFSSPEILKIDRLQIYDRWGTLLFEQNNFPPNQAQYGWDGHFLGKPVSPAVFAVVVFWTDLEGDQQLIRADATLLR